MFYISWFDWFCLGLVDALDFLKGVLVNALTVFLPVLLIVLFVSLTINRLKKSKLSPNVQILIALLGIAILVAVIVFLLLAVI